MWFLLLIAVRTAFAFIFTDHPNRAPIGKLLCMNDPPTSSFGCFNRPLEQTPVILVERGVQPRNCCVPAPPLHHWVTQIGPGALKPSAQWNSLLQWSEVREAKWKEVETLNFPAVFWPLDSKNRLDNFGNRGPGLDARTRQALHFVELGPGQADEEHDLLRAKFLLLKDKANVFRYLTSLDFSKGITLAVWFKPSPNPKKMEIQVISLADQYKGHYMNVIVRHRGQGMRTIQVHFQGLAPTRGVPLPSDNAWKHVSVVFGRNSEYSLFIDGKMKQSGVGTLTKSSLVVLGASLNNKPPPPEGSFACFFIFEEPLRESTVKRVLDMCK